MNVLARWLEEAGFPEAAKHTADVGTAADKAYDTLRREKKTGTGVKVGRN